ncbi:hypothetical protein E2562_023991 [Oryza meyeriana var. granulata]|uniref:Uncharacterized protein n=1 Tax=Oryza meyeriana var. granulata TaxID=110450 RepID=A0A6G1EDL6_9ORYZ|nr:hypothetical protein E2562_023991 [Oryza meyeriana var. granulata]
MAYSNTVVSRAAFGDESSCSLYSNVERGRKLKKVLTDFVELLGTEPMGELLPWLGWVDTLRGMEGKIGSRSLLLRHLSVAVAPSSSAASLRPTAALREALWGPRWMSSEEAKGSFLDKAKVTERIVKVVRNFQKIDDPAKEHQKLGPPCRCSQSAVQEAVESSEPKQTVDHWQRCSTRVPAARKFILDYWFRR